MWAKYFKPFLETYVLPVLLRAVLKFIYYTNKRVWILSDKIKDEPAIYVFWHGNLTMQAFFKAKHIHKGADSMLNSHHKDGALMVNTMKHFGLGTIRGSSRHGGVKALIDAVKFVKGGGSMSITPDGPSGPLHSIANGVVVLSQKGDIPIITQHIVASKAWRLKTWDHLTIPKPFGTLTFISGDPFKVTGLPMDEAKKRVQEELLKVEV